MKFPIRVRASALIIKERSILLVEFQDETGLHYNLPGGGVNQGESILDALKREAKEEANIDVEVGDLVFALEYEPKRNQFWAGNTHALTLIFVCHIVGMAEPQYPNQPDPHQTGVKWVSLVDLAAIELLPHLSEKIVAFATSQRSEKIFWEEPVAQERAQYYLRQQPN